MGPAGLREAANQCVAKAHYLADVLKAAGLTVENKGPFFHEFVTCAQVPAKKILARLEADGILGGLPLDEHRILWCCTEKNSKAEIDRVGELVKEVVRA